MLAFTGITLNHAGRIEAKPKVSERTATMPSPLIDALRALPAQGKAVTPDAVAAWADRVQDSNNERFVEAETSRGYSRPDHSRRVGRWRENLSAEDIALAWPIVAEPAEAFGYTRHGGGHRDGP